MKWTRVGSLSTPSMSVHMIGDDMELKRIIDEHEGFVKFMLKKQDEIAPMIIFQKDGKKFINMINGAGREHIKFLLNKMSDFKPEWLVFLSEGYMEKHDLKKEDTEQIKKNYVQGTLEMQFKMGNPNVSEVITISAYSPTGKLQRVLDKKTMKNTYGDTTEFEGFLTVSDVDRVFWNKT